MVFHRAPDAPQTHAIAADRSVWDGRGARPKALIWRFRRDLTRGLRRLRSTRLKSRGHAHYAEPVPDDLHFDTRAFEAGRA